MKHASMRQDACRPWGATTGEVSGDTTGGGAALHRPSGISVSLTTARVSREFCASKTSLALHLAVLPTMQLGKVLPGRLGRLLPDSRHLQPGLLLQL